MLAFVKRKLSSKPGFKWSVTGATAAMAMLATGSAFSQGFPNVMRTEGELLAGPVDPAMGRAAIVAWHGERIVVVPEGPGSQAGADVRMRVIDINDPFNPQSTMMGSYSGGIHAHAYFKSGDHLFVGGHCASADGLSPCAGNPGDFGANSLRIGGDGTNIGTSQLQRSMMQEDIGLYIGSYERMATQAPWGANDYWSYNTFAPTSFFGLRRGQFDEIYISDQPVGPGVRQTWNHQAMSGGVNGFAFLMGNILIYASDQSSTGVATYDVSDLDNPPVLLDVLKDENPGGYWPEIYGHYIFFPRRDAGEEGLDGFLDSNAGFMVVDFSDPTNLQVVADRDLPGSNQYVTFQDEYAFMNNYKIDMRTFEPVLELATNNTTLDASQFALPVGNLVVTGGYGATGPGIAIWAHQEEPDTRGPFVAYHIPRPDQTNYSTELPITLSIPETLRTETIVDGTTLILRPIGGDSVPTFHSFSQGKLLTVTSRQPLEEDTTYELVLTSGIQDAAGNGMEPYSFRFSTGGGLTGGNTAPTVTSVNADPAITEPGETIDFSWTGFDVEAGTLEYRIDFGDGSPRTEWSTDTDASHAYAEEGHYNVLVQVRDSEGAVGAYSRGVTVALAPDEPNSTASALMVLDSPGSRLYIANPDNDTVTAINTATEETVWEAPTSSHPKSVALANDGTLWVVCRDEDAIDVLNASTGALVQTILLDYGSIPVAIAPVPGGATMLVSTEGAESLLRFSVATRTQTGSVQLGPMPRAIAVTEDGQRALVTRFISAEHSGSVYDVSLAGSMSLTRTINLRRDRGPDGSASARGVPNYLSSVRIGPDGDYAWITCKKDNTTRGTFFSPTQALGQDNTVRAGILLIDLNTNAEDVSMRMDIDNSDSPSAIAFSPLGDYVFVALQGNNRIAVIDMFDFMTPGSPGTVLTHWDTGLAPQGVLADPATDRVFTGDFMDRSVSSFDASQFYASGVAVQSKTTISTVENERLHPEILLGKQIFYNASDSRMSAEGYISCATCHIDGSHDGRTFDFTSRGEGFRNTTDLRGRSGMGHGFVHWSGNFDEIQDFENDIRNEFGGDGFLTDEQFAGTSDTLGSPKAGLNDDLDALAAYVTSLGTKTIQRSPYRQSDGTLSAAAQNGQSIFAAQNCATCHVPGTDYTDRQAHNTGTLKASSGNRLGGALTGIDTPTLLGTFGGAPYFHDGSAATLEDVLTTSGGQLLQAEDAVLSGAAVATSITWLPLKDWHQFELVQFEGAGAITFNNVMSTAAGSGFIEIRYSIQGFATGTATVNGVDTAINFPGTGNNPGYEPNEWRKVRVPVNWNAGSNTVAISRNFGGVAVDDVLMMTAGDLVSANDHVRGLNAGDMADLIEYIQSLDGTNAATPDLSLTRDLTPIVSGATDELEPPGDASEFIITYVIENTGDGPLNIGQFHIETNPPGAMTIEEHPVPHIEAGEQTVLEIRLTNPSTPATAEVQGWTDAFPMEPLQWSINSTPSGITAVSNFWILE